MFHKIRKIWLPVFWLGVAAMAGLFSLVLAADFNMPDSFYVAEGETLQIDTTLPLMVVPEETINVSGSVNTKDGYFANLKLWGVIPVKKVQVNPTKTTDVIVLGDSFGIKIFTKGVLVTDMQAVDTKNGSVCPGEESGIKKGDFIEGINGIMPISTEHAAELISKCGGEEIEMIIRRGDQTLNLTLKPQYSQSEKTYKAGLWIKDSSAGIGTLTFYSPTLDVVAGLGHGVVDNEVLTLLPLNKGQMVCADIFSYRKSINGAPGELKGRFALGSIGSIVLNNETGVFARAEATFSGETLPIALKQEIKTEKAQIITTIDSNGPMAYDCTIKRINYKSNEKTKNMLICITDSRLLSTTGGIVQGMSGSPIIQNGKLIGAVTHVLVDDPTKGYAIFAENMLETAQSVANKQLKEAS